METTDFIVLLLPKIVIYLLKSCKSLVAIALALLQTKDSEGSAGLEVIHFRLNLIFVNIQFL